MQKLFEPKFWTISAFFLPLVMTAYFGLYINAVIIFLVIIASFIYHWGNEKNFKFIDKVLAWTLIISNLILCYLGNFQEPYFEVVLILVFIALYFLWYRQKKYSYNFNHGVWHIASALITVFSILTYAMK